VEAGVAFNWAEAAIASADWTKLPISPIDYIKQKIEDADIRLGNTCPPSSHESANDLGQELSMGLENMAPPSRSCIIFRTVGWTLQLQIPRLVTASCGTNCSDQRQRVMYIVQPHLDVNQVEQSIGRSHRSGKLIQHFTHLIDRTNRTTTMGQYAGTLPILG